LLCIFPFEEEFFRKSGINAQFVGHPLLGRVAPSMDSAEFRAKFSIPAGHRMVALLPGSRRKEVSLNLPPIVEAACAISRLASQGQSHVEVTFVVPAASEDVARVIRDYLAKNNASGKERFVVVEHHTYDAVGNAAAAIVASGTATVETALLGTPMVVVYRVTKASWFLGRRLVKVPFLSMVNLIAEREVVPEYIQHDFQPDKVATALLKLIDDSGERARMCAGLGEVARRLRAGAAQGSDAIERAVEILASMLEAKAPGNITAP
jgi:lipid-A-disaccharide synthase